MVTKIKNIHQKQVDFFNSGATKNWTFQSQQLKKLKQAIIDHNDELIDAVKQDLKKPEFEVITSELMLVIEEINLFLKKGKEWGKTIKVPRSLITLDGQGEIQQHPHGVVLIIAPWNYPVQLALIPVIGALATGNTVILKPSELAPKTSAILSKMLRKTFDPKIVTVIEGDVAVTQEILQLAFDKIFFTGSPQVGQIIMEQAAKHLTPVTLELGGKSPVIIDRLSEQKLEKSLRRILWGKFLNSGQTCIAPDYLLIHQDDEKLLNKILKKVIIEFVREKPYCPIVNEKHYNRIKNYLLDEEVLFGGLCNDSDHSIELTILKPKSIDSSLMKDEIFGPILPILTYLSKEEAKNTIVNVCKYPLAMYVFTEDKTFEDYFINNISFGGGCVNDTISHILVHDLPFGGVRSSGMGSYHGKSSFECFSRKVSVFKKGFLFELPFRYPLHDKGIKIVKQIIKNYYK